MTRRILAIRPAGAKIGADLRAEIATDIGVARRLVTIAILNGASLSLRQPQRDDGK
jgi:hypothetical protein